MIAALFYLFGAGLSFEKGSESMEFKVNLGDKFDQFTQFINVS